MSKYLEQRLPYFPEMSAFYHSLSHLSGFVLLESLDKRYGRYDIITAFPYRHESRSALTGGGVVPPPQLDFEPTASASSLPFQGGAIAALSYDYGCVLNGIPSVPMGEADFPYYYFAWYDWAIVVDHHFERCTLVARHQQPETASILREIQRLWRSVEIEDSGFSISSLQGRQTRETYRQHFELIQDALSRGRCYQINYSQAFGLETDADPWQLYRRIRKTNPVPFAAFMRCGKQAVLSFSPERFLRVNPDGSVLTSPIKGSMARDSDPRQDYLLSQQLLNSAKNRAENVMIVDLLRNDLSRICQAGSVRVRKLMELQSFAAIHHMVSHIEGQLKPDISPLWAMLRCFPGGSITGAPKIEAMKMIAELEQRRRGIYCGSIAYFSHHGQADSNIAIRTLTCRDNQVQLAAGGGIVLDSNWQDEYTECYIKIKAIMKAIYGKIPT